jgi:hypothetical protein
LVEEASPTFVIIRGSLRPSVRLKCSRIVAEAGLLTRLYDAFDKSALIAYRSCADLFRAIRSCVRSAVSVVLASVSASQLAQ